MRRLWHRIGAALGTLGVLAPVLEAVQAPPLRDQLPAGVRVASALLGALLLLVADRRKVLGPAPPPQEDPSQTRV